MKNVVNLYKPLGLTPLQAIQEFRRTNHLYQNKKIAYAGRLDPLAEGVLLLLIEPETKNRSNYQNLDKVYEFEVLFGVETDTYDILGIPRNPNISFLSRPDFGIQRKTLENIAKKLTGTYMQKYPPYSSKQVSGKPLYWWARRQKLNEIIIPEKYITIHGFNLLKLFHTETHNLQKHVLKRLKLVKGDFRQKEIISSWKLFFKNNKDSHIIASFNIHCTSGTYIRGIVYEMGKALKIGAIALGIKRISVGRYTENKSIRLPV